MSADWYFPSRAYGSRRMDAGEKPALKVTAFTPSATAPAAAMDPPRECPVNTILSRGTPRVAAIRLIAWMFRLNRGVCRGLPVKMLLSVMASAAVAVPLIAKTTLSSVPE